MENQNSKNWLSVPVAVILAGILIAGAIFISGSNRDNNKTKTNTNVVKNTETTPLDKMYPINEKDHILGDPNALVKIVEYSDFECPFCKRFHKTMNQIINEYGKSGQVAWVYRHFPLDKLHPKNARRVAKASECASEIGDKNNTFWQFANKYFLLTPSNDQVNYDKVISQIITDLKIIDKNKFNACMDSNKYNKHIQDDFDNAVATGGRGTPWSIVIAPNGKTFPIDGAQPISVVKQIIEVALQEK